MGGRLRVGGRLRLLLGDAARRDGRGSSREYSGGGSSENDEEVRIVVGL